MPVQMIYLCIKYVIITAIPSLKLCMASEIRDRLPEIIPPIISTIVIKKFNMIVIKKRVVLVSFIELWCE